MIKYFIEKQGGLTKISWKKSVVDNVISMLLIILLLSIVKWRFNSEVKRTHFNIFWQNYKVFQTYKYRCNCIAESITHWKIKLNGKEVRVLKSVTYTQLLLQIVSKTLKQCLKMYCKALQKEYRFTLKYKPQKYRKLKD